MHPLNIDLNSSFDNINRKKCEWNFTAFEKIILNVTFNLKSGWLGKCASEYQ